MLLTDLPTGRDIASTKRRRALFARLDIGQNGYLSLPQIAVGLNVAATPTLAHALEITKDIVPDVSTVGDELVDWREFRLFLSALRSLQELKASFGWLGNNDSEMRLSLGEFKSGLSVLHEWGVTLRRAEVEAEFELIDAAGSGAITGTVRAADLLSWAVGKRLREEDEREAGRASPRSPSHSQFGGPSAYAYERNSNIL